MSRNSNNRWEEGMTIQCEMISFAGFIVIKDHHVSTGYLSQVGALLSTGECAMVEFNDNFAAWVLVCPLDIENVKNGVEVNNLSILLFSWHLLRGEVLSALD